MTDAAKTPAPNLDMGDRPTRLLALVARLMGLSRGRWIIVLDTRHERSTWAITRMGETEHA